MASLVWLCALACVLTAVMLEAGARTSGSRYQSISPSGFHSHGSSGSRSYGSQSSHGSQGSKFHKSRYHSSNQSSSCKPPTIYHAEGTFEDTDEFFDTFDKNLQDNQCDSLDYAKIDECSWYKFDWPYTAIFSYLKTACLYDYSKSSYLRELLSDYCDYHCPDSDKAVADAYNCSSGCKLADQLNQLCLDIDNSNVELECPTPYEENNGSCYFFATEEVSALEALVTCLSMSGGSLVQIDSKEENDFITMRLNTDSAPPYVLIGLTDFVTEGTHRWVSSPEIPPTYLNWDPEIPQPDNGGGNQQGPVEECVIIDRSKGGTWFDRRCRNRHRPYICETRSRSRTDQGTVRAREGSGGNRNGTYMIVNGTALNAWYLSLKLPFQ